MIIDYVHKVQNGVGEMNMMMNNRSYRKDHIIKNYFMCTVKNELISNLTTSPSLRRVQCVNLAKQDLCQEGLAPYVPLWQSLESRVGWVVFSNHHSSLPSKHFSKISSLA
jgi:hypothetical protein